MHFEFLIEDQSGKVLLESLLPEIIGESHTYKVIAYKGVGRVPKNLRSGTDANRRILLDRLPPLLRGYGKAFRYYQAAVFVVCDLDKKCFKQFRQELLRVLSSCDPQPETRFCIAIEEGEAWLLGDLQAVKEAYPRARDQILNSYIQDSVCGTWELLAEAVYRGGRQALTAKGWRAVGEEKSEWARSIAPHMDVHANRSPSFNYFLRKLSELSE